MAPPLPIDHGVEFGVDSALDATNGMRVLPSSGIASMLMHFDEGSINAAQASFGLLG